MGRISAITGFVFYILCILVRPCQFIYCNVNIRSYPGVWAGPQVLHGLHQAVRAECGAVQDQDLPCQGDVDQGEGCRHPHCKYGVFWYWNINWDPPCQGDHSHDSGLLEVFVNQLRERKLQKSCEEVSKPPRELWVELRAEVSQQFGQTGEIFLGTQPFTTQIWIIFINKYYYVLIIF